MHSECLAGLTPSPTCLPTHDQHRETIGAPHIDADRAVKKASGTNQCAKKHGEITCLSETETQHTTCVYMRTHTCTNAHTRAHTYTHTHTHTHTHTRTHTHTHTHAHTHTRHIVDNTASTELTTGSIRNFESFIQFP